MDLKFTSDTIIALAALLMPFAILSVKKMKSHFFGKLHFRLPYHSAITVEYSSTGLVCKVAGTLLSPDEECYVESVEGLWVSELDRAERELLWMGTISGLNDEDSEKFELPTIYRVPKGQPVQLRFVLQNFRSVSEVQSNLQAINEVFQNDISARMKEVSSELIEDPEQFMQLREAASKQAWVNLKTNLKFQDARQRLSKIFPLSPGRYGLKLKIRTLAGKCFYFNYVVTLNASQIDQLDGFNQVMMINFICERKVPGFMYYKAFPLYEPGDSTLAYDVRAVGRKEKESE